MSGCQSLRTHSLEGSMLNIFIAGGWGMYPTLLAGIALIATCVQYARRPAPRYVPLMLSLGLCTLIAGTLGFATGILSLLQAYSGPLWDQGPRVLFIGTFEALHNVALALLLAMLGALLASIGAWRLSHRMGNFAAPAAG
ncbi:hypothetical protein JKA73_20220 [Myxococcus xanthus]|nr:hypothetical protein JKA73_20220 [Myxococcus xanthus]